MGLPHDRLGGTCQSQQRVDIAPNKSKFDRSIGHGRELKERRAHPDIGVRGSNIIIETLLDPLTLALIVELHQDITEVGHHRLRAARQVVARRGATHGDRDIFHLLLRH